jgi:patatin-like phospholipase/acyl hydrolase
MNPTILAIDGGGVRGAIPLEYLLLIQESLGRDCKIHDLIDLSVGSSSGTFEALICRFNDLPERSISKNSSLFFFFDLRLS